MLTREQKRRDALKILEDIEASEESKPLVIEQEETVETVESEPIPLEIADAPATPEENANEGESSNPPDRRVSLMSYLGHRIDDTPPAAATEEEGDEESDRYSYTNFTSCVDTTMPLNRGGTPEELLQQLAGIDKNREWRSCSTQERSRSEILQVFNLDSDLDEISLAASLSELGIGLEAIGADKYLTKVWAN